MTRVLLADDHRLEIEGIRDLLTVTNSAFASDTASQSGGAAVRWSRCQAAFMDTVIIGPTDPFT